MWQGEKERRDLRETAIVEQELAKKIGDSPIFAVEVGRIFAWGHGLLERQSYGSKWVRQAIVR